MEFVGLKKTYMYIYATNAFPFQIKNMCKTKIYKVNGVSSPINHRANSMLCHTMWWVQQSPKFRCLP